MSKCKVCKNKMITISTCINEWEADEEPYKNGVKEELNYDIYTSTVYINAEYCEVCDKFACINIEAPIMDKEEKENE